MGEEEDTASANFLLSSVERYCRDSAENHGERERERERERGIEEGERRERCGGGMRATGFYLTRSKA